MSGPARDMYDGSTHGPRYYPLPTTHCPPVQSLCVAPVHVSRRPLLPVTNTAAVPPPSSAQMAGSDSPEAPDPKEEEGCRLDTFVTILNLLTKYERQPAPGTEEQRQKLDRMINAARWPVSERPASQNDSTSEDVQELTAAAAPIPTATLDAFNAATPILPAPHAAAPMRAAAPFIKNNIQGTPSPAVGLGLGLGFRIRAACRRGRVDNRAGTNSHETAHHNHHSERNLVAPAPLRHIRYINRCSTVTATLMGPVTSCIQETHSGNMKCSSSQGMGCGASPNCSFVTKCCMCCVGLSRLLQRLQCIEVLKL